MNSTSLNSRPGSYDLIAQEYYDPIRHPTCSNFNQLSRVYLRRHFDMYAHRRPILETGAGSSAAAELLHGAGLSLHGLTITDSSAQMLSHSNRWIADGAEVKVGEAEHVRSPPSSFDVLISSLGDPYNTPTFWRESSRVLRPEGLVVFTTPSYQWAARYRASNERGLMHIAEFQLSDGSEIHVPSLILSLDVQIEMMERAGFMVIDFEDLGADQLGSAEIRSPKTQVFSGELTSLVWGFIARKDGYPLKDSVRRSWQESPI